VCHLPGKDEYFAHRAGKCWAGLQHTAVHFFGTYNDEASRQFVLQTLPNGRCTGCHGNLAGCSSSSAVGIVHALALAPDGGRAHACVACHDKLHGPRTAAPPKKTYQHGDNSFCLVCHVNFEKEPFAVAHVKAGVSCFNCHGDSEKHAGDEEHFAPADILFPKDRVNASCTTAECHPRAAMEAEIGHRPFFAGADAAHPYCTDCHGQHRLAQRKRRWDKTTRELIEVDGRAVPPSKPGGAPGGATPAKDPDGAPERGM
jgi:hypothetical protein